LKLLTEYRLDTLERLFGFSLEAEYQHRCGVGSTAQAPAIGKFNADAISEVNDLG